MYMTTGEIGRAVPGAANLFAHYHPWDRNFFLTVVGLIWLGILVGFGGDMIDHVRAHGPAYPLIVHVHAAAYVGWLSLLTGQVLLIRSGRADLHRRLGVVAFSLIPVMIFLGLAVSWVIAREEFTRPDAHPQFISVQLMGLADFTLLAGGGLLLRRAAGSHKRLILLGTLSIASAGFFRWLADPISYLVGNDFWGTLAQFYLGNDLIILLIGAYDLATRGRLQGAYVVGLAWLSFSELVATWLFFNPAWKAIAIRLIGY
jgi:hypothetical protein